MRPFATIRLLSLLVVLCRPAMAEPISIPALVTQLDDADFARREAAARQLAERGSGAIEALVAAAQGDSPEVASRSVGLLERLMVSDDDATLDAADAALVTLVESDQPHAVALATAALGRHALVREQRAIVKIEELGGQVQYAPDVDLMGRPLGMIPANGSGEQAEEPPLRPKTILLGRQWKGGTDGLEYVRRLSHRRDLILYVVQGSGVPLAEAQSLASVLPGLIVNHRGPYLGVGAITNGPVECIIGEVKPNAPADKAGLRRHDTVLSLDEHKIQSFHDLVETLKQYDEGKTVTMTIRRFDPVARQNRVLDIKVELGTWELPRITDAPANGIRFPQQMPAMPKLPPRPVPPPSGPVPK